MGFISKLIGWTWRAFVGSIYWFSVAFTSIILSLATYHMVMNTIANPLQWRLWAFTLFTVSLTGIWWYFRFYKPQRLLTGIVKQIHFAVVVVVVIAIFFALFFAAVIATTDLAEQHLSAAETLLQREFWDATWLSPEWRQNVLWNESEWTHLITKALIDVNWWQQEVLPWAIEQVKLHAALADRLTGASIIAAAFAPIMGSLVAAGGLLRFLIPMISKALGAGFVSKMVQMAMMKMQRKFEHIADQDIGITALIKVFKEFRRAGMQRGKLANKLVKAANALLKQIDDLPENSPEEAALKVKAYEEAHSHLDKPLVRLNEALDVREEHLDLINACLRGYNTETAELEREIAAAQKVVDECHEGFVAKWRLKRVVKQLQKQLAEVIAKYDGKTVYSKILSRKPGAFKVPGEFQKLYPAYSLHEKTYTIPAISDLWGQLGDLETTMSRTYGIEIDVLDDMQQVGMLGLVKEMLVNLVKGRKKQDEQVEMMAEQIQLLTKLVQQTAPSKLPVKKQQAQR